MTRCRASICLYSTKTNLGDFIAAVERVSQEVGGGVRLEALLYQSEVDEEKLEWFRGRLRRCDIVLLDVRSVGLIEERLFEAIRAAAPRLVVPLVAGDPRVFRLVRMGRLSGESLRMGGELGPDTGIIDASRIARMLGVIEKLAATLPVGTLRDTRNWIRVMRYWWLGGLENYANMLRLLLREYMGCRVSKPSPPREPARPGSVMGGGAPPRVLVILYSGMHYWETRRVYEALAEALEARGLTPVAVVAGGNFDLVDNPRYIREALQRIGRVEALVNLQWFRLRGGPYGGDPEPAIRLLREIDAPLFNGLILYTRRVSDWERDDRGLSPIEVLAGVALPEADGAIEPIPSAGLGDDPGRSITPIRDRIERKAARIAAWVSLRLKPRNERRIAIIVYNYPPDPHNIGSASYLDVSASLEALLRALHDAGYQVDRIPSKEEVTRLLREARDSCHELLDHGLYARLYAEEVPPESRRRVEEVWGPPPRSPICIRGFRVGNVFIGIQPSRGVHEDPEKIYHSKDLPPPHEYIAFYLWLRRVYRADAMLHLGTHGTLEFMPGKEVGLDSKSYPDILVGETPHVYIYHVTNASELSIAKRRGYAYTVTHAPPPYTRSGLYGDLLELKELIDEYHEALVMDPERAKLVEEIALEKARSLGIRASSVEEVHSKLYEYERSVIPRGLHVLGRRWSLEEAVEYLTLLTRYDGEAPSLQRLLVEARGLDYYKLLEEPGRVYGGVRGSDVLREAEELAARFARLVAEGRLGNAVRLAAEKGVPRGEAKRVAEYLRRVYERIEASDELGGVLAALDGRYVEPGVAGDPLRTPESLPTGRHGYAFDPRLVPSMAAYKRGAMLAEKTLRLYREKTGRYPESVAVVLWGFETAGTRGETIGQILQYLGVRLVRRGPWSWSLEPIPLEELGRPRIDVVVTICGIFRDTFPHLVELLDHAFRLVASLDEPTEANYVRKHVAELRAAGVAEKEATARIFGPKPGAYNTRVTELVETSRWRSEAELAETYMADMGYAYGSGLHGKPLHAVLRGLLSRVEMVTQIRYAHEYDVTDLDHYYEFLGGLVKSVEEVRGAKPLTLWLDTTREAPRVKEVGEAIVDALHTRLLNPRWLDAMLAHGYDGAREVAERVEYLLGLAATTGGVPEWAWERLYERLVADEETRRRISSANPDALREIASRLLEAAERGYWAPSGDKLEALRRLSEGEG